MKIEEITLQLRWAILMTEGLRFTHLSIAPQLKQPRGRQSCSKGLRDKMSKGKHGFDGWLATVGGWKELPQLSHFSPDCFASTRSLLTGFSRACSALIRAPCKSTVRCCCQIWQPSATNSLKTLITRASK